MVQKPGSESKLQYHKKKKEKKTKKKDKEQGEPGQLAN
jgi:hypothetical protein